MWRANWWSAADLGLLFYHDQIPEALERRVLGSVEWSPCAASTTRWRSRR
jgi:hypothetical protein